MKEPIYLLFDKEVLERADLPDDWDFVSEGYAEDQYRSKFFPINYNREACYFDFHLPIDLLIRKYNKQTMIEFISLDNLKPGQQFIYLIHFSYFHDFVRKMPLKKLIDQMPGKIRQGLIEGNGILILNDSHEYANYLDISKQLKLPEKYTNRVFITSSNPDNQEYIGQADSRLDTVKNKLIRSYKQMISQNNLQVFGFRFFEEVVAYQMRKYFQDYTFNERIKALSSRQFKQYICLNNVNKDFRTAIVMQLFKKGMVERGYVSHKMLINKDIDLLNSRFSSLVEGKDVSAFQQQLPLVADTIEAAVFNPWNIMPVDLISASFLWLVTETVYHGSGLSRCYFTEKTYKPMAFFMPFILVAQPFALKQLKAEGYKTFGKWWDESYDEERDSVKRIRMITELIRSICHYSKEEIINIYNEMRPVLEHNHNKLLNSQAAKPYIKKLLERYYE